MDDLLHLFEEEALLYKVQLNADAANKMLRFMELVLNKNEVINLTTITEREEFIQKHLIDSISCYAWPEIAKADSIVDIGTGAGFPGIPLAICYPEKKFTLIDSLNKRIEFLKEVVEELNITNVTLVHSRAEDAGRDISLREKFDLCVTRAVAPLNVLLEYCIPLIKPQGSMYAYKTEKAIAEIEDSSLALRLLGASLDVQIRAYNYSLENEEIEKQFASPYSKRIFVIKKEKNTPKEYPRKPGTPKKVPL